MRRKEPRHSGKRGRPRRGVRRGERLRDYPSMTVRMPPNTRAMLRVLSRRRGVPTWLMLRHLVVCYVRALPARERRHVLQRSRIAA